MVLALDEAAAGGGVELPHDALHAFRTRLEEHLCYWRPPVKGRSRIRDARMTLKERHEVKRQQPGARTGRWTDAEHKEFLRLHVIHGRRWTLIADEMPFRTEPQIGSHAQKHYLKVSQREAQEAAERAAVALGHSLPARHEHHAVPARGGVAPRGAPRTGVVGPGHGPRAHARRPRRDGPGAPAARLVCGRVGRQRERGGLRERAQVAAAAAVCRGPERHPERATDPAADDETTVQPRRSSTRR